MSTVETQIIHSKQLKLVDLYPNEVHRMFEVHHCRLPPPRPKKASHFGFDVVWGEMTL